MFMPPHTQIERAVALALAEDVGDGDITSVATVPASTQGKAVFTVKASGVQKNLIGCVRSISPLLPVPPLGLRSGFLLGHQLVVSLLLLGC